MQALGHTVNVFVGGNGPFVNFLMDRGIPVTSLLKLVRNINPVQDFLAYKELKWHLENYDPDLVHLHSSKAGILGRLVAKTLALPCIFTAHGWAFTDGVAPVGKALYRAIERWAAPMANAIITVSEYDKNLALRYEVSKPEQLFAIHNGVPDVAQPPNEPFDGRFVRIIMVARFDAQKNQEALLRALSTLKQYAWNLQLIGSGPRLEAMKLLAETLGIDQRVQFPGNCDDVPVRLARSDIFVLSSNWEGLPLSILEAMRGSLPVVASDVGGVTEIVKDGCTGFVVHPGEVDSLSQKLKELIENPQTRQRMGISGRSLYEEKFNVDRMVKETLSLYRLVINNHK
jgi:glycosyltransferase involved in cell wall biosynthesis